MHSAGGLLQAVQQQLHTDKILGWFAYRSSSSLQPTVQEEVMSSSLTAACNSLWGPQDAAILFALVSVQRRHDDSSYEFQQRMFQLDSNRYCCPQCKMYDGSAFMWLTNQPGLQQDELCFGSSPCVEPCLGTIEACMCAQQVSCVCKGQWQFAVR